MFISNNYDSGYTAEAIEAAKQILIEKYGGLTDFVSIWDKEIQKLLELDKKCSLCSCEKIVYSEKIYFCAEDEIDVKKSVPGVIALVAFGIGYTKHKIQYKADEFKLCNNCLNTHLTARKDCTVPEIQWEEYYKHPLYQMYSLFGFREIRH
ncbi:MAG: hypothetical protein JXA46_14430 [Dehalococcoidales bacterium]|nr:hypothetical protein [Dehalococcoidales bacterium]